MNSYGLCQCGCQQTTPIAKMTDSRRGYRKGEHTKYCPGHIQRTQGKTALVVQHWTGEITDHDLINLRGADIGEAAMVIDARVRQIEKQTRSNFVELGLLCLEVKNRDLWAKLTDTETGCIFHSCDDWMSSALNVSRSSAYAAMKAIEATRGIPIEDLKAMTRENLQQFARLSTSVQPKYLEDAKRMSVNDFVTAINLNEPNQHLSKAPKLIINLESPARNAFDEAIEIAKFAQEVSSREEAIEAIVAYYCDGLCERNGYAQMSNREAYEMAKKRSVA